MGYAEFDISVLKNEKIHTYWLKLTPGSHKKAKVSGEIKLQLQLSHSEVKNLSA